MRALAVRVEVQVYVHIPRCMYSVCMIWLEQEFKGHWQLSCGQHSFGNIPVPSRSSCIICTVLIRTGVVFTCRLVQLVLQCSYLIKSMVSLLLMIIETLCVLAS